METISIKKWTHKENVAHTCTHKCFSAIKSWKSSHLWQQEWNLETLCQVRCQTEKDKYCIMVVARNSGWGNGWNVQRWSRIQTSRYKINTLKVWTFDHLHTFCVCNVQHGDSSWHYWVAYLKVIESRQRFSSQEKM